MFWSLTVPDKAAQLLYKNCQCVRTGKMSSRRWLIKMCSIGSTLNHNFQGTGATTLPDESGNRVTTLKRRMERLRIPLAKMETARRFPTDSAIAYPTISRDFGLAWHVAQDTYISRRELSDQLLDFLADLKKRQTQKKT